MSDVKVYSVKIEPVEPDFILTCRYYMGSCYYNCDPRGYNHCVYTAFKVTVTGEITAEIPPETDTKVQLRIRKKWLGYPWHYFYYCDEKGSCTPNWEIAHILDFGRYSTIGSKESKTIKKQFKYSFTLFACDYENNWRINSTWKLKLVFDLFDYMWHEYAETVTVTFHFDRAKRILIEERYIDDYYKLYYIDVPIETPSQKIVLSADRTRIHEGETVNFTADVYGSPSTSVKACVYVEGRRGDCHWVSLDSSGHGVLKFSATFPSYGAYNVKVCVVNPLTNESIYCSNEVTITVEKVGKPKLAVTINLDKTEVYIGDKVKVYGKVKNIGDGSFGGGTLYIYVDGNVVKQFPVPSIPPNHYINYSYELTLWEKGKHTICVDVK